MTLTDLEYGVIMQAINNAKNEIAEDTFIDPYDNEFEVTNEQCLDAINNAEKKIMSVFLVA